MKWIKCSEQLPLKKERVIVWGQYGNNQKKAPYFALWINDYEWQDDNDCTPLCKVTHWMPLPDEPKES